MFSYLGNKCNQVAGKTKSCNKCGKTGHFKDMCRSGKRTGKRKECEDKSFKPDDFESQPVTRLAVQVSTKSYTANNIKPPSAYRHRQADLEMLADTGSQAVIMGTNQLGQLGLTVRDLMQCALSLTRRR